MPVTWNFDRLGASKSKRGGSSAWEIFAQGIDSLVREVLQNSKDAALDGECVTVRFHLKELSGSERDDIFAAVGWSSLKPHVEAASQADFVSISPRLKAGLAEVDGSSTRVLFIEDSNAVGLTGDEDEDSHFADLVKHELVSSSKSGKSGGSFGLGKSVLWLFSMLSSVIFFSSLSDEEDGESERFIGRTMLPAHKIGVDSFDGVGLCGTSEGIPPSERAVSVWGEEAIQTAAAAGMARSSPGSGTSIAVLAFNDPTQEEQPSVEDACAQICASVSRWFWPALEDGALTVFVRGSVDGEIVFEEKNVEARLPETAPFIDTRDAEGCTEDLEEAGDVVEFPIEVDLPAQRDDAGLDDPKPATKAELLLRVRLAAKGETADLNTIACQRGTGMVVTYREQPAFRNYDRGMHGVLVAGLARGSSQSDAALEEFLRASEPPAHEEWRPDTARLKANYKIGYGVAIRALWGAVDEALRSIVRDEPSTETEIPKRLQDLFKLPGVGDVEEKQKYQLMAPKGTTDGETWEFSGRFGPTAGDPEGDWLFTIGMSLDQEGGGAGERLPIAKLTCEGEGVSWSDNGDGTYKVLAPSSVGEVAFRGETAVPEGLPEGGAKRVALRMVVTGGLDDGGRT